jgi:hypothetical protein
MATFDSFPEHSFSRAEIAELARKYWLLVTATLLAGTAGMWLSFPILFTNLYHFEVVFKRTP